jgi:hypothetical protein
MASQVEKIKGLKKLPVVYEVVTINKEGKVTHLDLEKSRYNGLIYVMEAYNYPNICVIAKPEEEEKEEEMEADDDDEYKKLQIFYKIPMIDEEGKINHHEVDNSMITAMIKMMEKDISYDTDDTKTEPEEKESNEYNNNDGDDNDEWKDFKYKQLQEQWKLLLVRKEVAENMCVYAGSIGNLYFMQVMKKIRQFQSENSTYKFEIPGSKSIDPIDSSYPSKENIKILLDFAVEYGTSMNFLLNENKRLKEEIIIAKSKIIRKKEFIEILRSLQEIAEQEKILGSLQEYTEEKEERMLERTSCFNTTSEEEEEEERKKKELPNIKWIKPPSVSKSHGSSSESSSSSSSSSEDSSDDDEEEEEGDMALIILNNFYKDMHNCKPSFLKEFLKTSSKCPVLNTLKNIILTIIRNRDDSISKGIFYSISVFRYPREYLIPTIENIIKKWIVHWSPVYKMTFREEYKCEGVNLDKVLYWHVNLSWDDLKY